MFKIKIKLKTKVETYNWTHIIANEKRGGGYLHHLSSGQGGTEELVIFYGKMEGDNYGVILHETL